MEFTASSETQLQAQQRRMLKSLRETKRIISKPGLSGVKELRNSHHLNGTFKQLCEENAMVEILFPGTSPEVLQALPKNLKEVVFWDELELDFEKIARNAAEVLENIKVRGKRQGDIMDETTEEILLPQIAQEALAKGIIESVRKLSRKVSATSARISAAIASSESELAHLDQLDDSVIQAVESAKSLGIQRDYMGEEWTSVIRDDMLRYIQHERLSLINVDGSVVTSSDKETEAKARMCWIEQSSEIQQSYPALAEVIRVLHALPYELNRKCFMSHI